MSALLPLVSELTPLAPVRTCGSPSASAGVKGVQEEEPSSVAGDGFKKRGVKDLKKLLNLLLASKDLVSHKLIKQAKVCTPPASIGSAA